MNNKPVELLIKELQDGLYSTINNSGLTVTVIKLVLDTIYRDIVDAEQKNAQEVIQKYYQSLSEQPQEVPTVEAEMVNPE